MTVLRTLTELRIDSRYLVYPDLEGEISVSSVRLQLLEQQFILR